ncbi:helix-turn-helix protein [Chitinophaga niastensis]|uniref:Helix-turn-helix protein n=1 Tax=Chitinophaga niastensis TaxID=536980 RepID=A0A2P8HGJ8_CHINA|nr:helix-turn-helix domain-containing protein [Chitinophaga niastensis]PSL45345.1 helix-turn-helix protein [Chitinophaga niastensis]
MQHSYKILIKGMVCDRCILTIRQLFHELEIPFSNISLGEVTTVAALSLPDMTILEERLRPLGFTLLEDKKKKLIREVKALVELVYSGSYDFPDDFRFSDIVVANLNKDYNVVSTIFSAEEGITLEKYLIEYRIEKVKELLVYTADTLPDIAFKLGFSSAPHLSRQFKAQTGLNPSYFKEIRKSKLSYTQKEGNTD